MKSVLETLQFQVLGEFNILTDDVDLVTGATITIIYLI